MPCSRPAALVFSQRGAGPAVAPLDIDRIAWAAPVAGAAVGLIGALALALTALLGLPLLLRAAFATAALVVATGALHEDGLADVADGFGGGATPARKLEIMRDSRIGAYGAIALVLALILRVGALAAALDGGFWRAALSLILVAALSRAAALTPLALLRPARADGAADHVAELRLVTVERHRLVGHEDVIARLHPSGPRPGALLAIVATDGLVLREALGMQARQQAVEDGIVQYAWHLCLQGRRVTA